MNPRSETPADRLARETFNNYLAADRRRQAEAIAPFYADPSNEE